ncbi:MAG: hypothetical protein HUK40_08785 [Desulfobacter sp.]|nr:hypothetical protein [Desulfobacter sp.]WDP84729.1 MAG: hypothetical protein HUN05_05865 [Desulfobacter sp.]
MRPEFLYIRRAVAITMILAWAIRPEWVRAAPSYCIQSFENGAINWSTGQVMVTGHAQPEINTEAGPTAMPGSARANAIRNIITILKQIKISPDLTVGEYASAHDVILAGIEKTAQDAVITQQLYTSAMDVEVKMETRIFGGFLQLVLPDHIRQIPKITEMKSKPVPEGKSNRPEIPINKIPYTGLVVDARDLGLDPILYPVIVSEQGKEIYSSMFVSREFAVQYGVATYLCDMETALSFKRIGSNPLVFKALRKADNKTNAVMVSMKDAKSLEKSTERHKFLKECRVVIVADQ